MLGSMQVRLDELRLDYVSVQSQATVRHWISWVTIIIFLFGRSGASSEFRRVQVALSEVAVGPHTHTHTHTHTHRERKKIGSIERQQRRHLSYRSAGLLSFFGVDSLSLSLSLSLAVSRSLALAVTLIGPVSHSRGPWRLSECSLRSVSVTVAIVDLQKSKIQIRIKEKPAVIDQQYQNRC